MIVPMAKMRLLAQALQVRVDENDLAHGFVDAECAAVIEVRSNSRCRVAFEPTASWFNRVHVYGFPRAIDVGPEGGAFVRPLERQRSSLYQLSFRFELRADALPGSYPWPLAVSLRGDWEERPARVSAGGGSSRTSSR